MPGSTKKLPRNPPTYASHLADTQAVNSSTLTVGARTRSRERKTVDTRRWLLRNIRRAARRSSLFAEHLSAFGSQRRRLGPFLRALSRFSRATMLSTSFVPVSCAPDTCLTIRSGARWSGNDLYARALVKPCCPEATVSRANFADVLMRLIEFLIHRGESHVVVFLHAVKKSCQRFESVLHDNAQVRLVLHI